MHSIAVRGLAKRGDRPEWLQSQDHWANKDTFAAIQLNDPVFEYR
jgi:hypothetical protein